MKRILFVDDDLAVLRGLERVLRAYGDQWKCVFIGNPAEALDLIGTGWPDAVVSDMRMPRIDGIEVLAKARADRPDCARLILSGEVGTGALLPLLAVAHQCIGKPCKADLLVRILTRLLISDDSGTSAKLNEKLRGLLGLPVMPTRHRELSEALNAAPVEREAKVLQALSRSPAMTSKILQAAGCVRLGSAQGVASLTDAIRLLGPETIAALINSDSCRPMSEVDIDLTRRRIWREGAAATAVARAIATVEQCAPEVAAQAVLLTVLSGAGTILLDATWHEDYVSMLAEAETEARDRTVPELERDRFGVSSAEAAARLFRLWGIHDPTVDLVATLDDAGKQTTGTLGPSGIAHIAKALVRMRPGTGLQPDSLDYLVRLGLVDRLPAWEKLAELQSEPEPC